MARTGRPKVEIDENSLLTLLQNCPSLVHTAAILKVSKNSIERFIQRKYKMTFGEYRDHCMAPVITKIQNAVIAKALKGSIKHEFYVLNRLGEWKNQVEVTIKDHDLVIEDENAA